MLITGTHNTAVVYTDNVEASASDQIRGICNQPAFSNSNIRIMPDCHSGKGCVIGTTMTIQDKVVPSFVGVDIGCTVSAYKLLIKEPIDFNILDKVIRANIPSGFNCRNNPLGIASSLKLETLRCLASVNLTRALLSVGTLGGGNHFIEIDIDPSGNYWLVVHTGSRSLGTGVAGHYQNIALQKCVTQANEAAKRAGEQLVGEYKAQGRQKEIRAALEALPKQVPTSMDYNYVEGEDLEDYLHDMSITQDYALANHKAIKDIICQHMGWEVESQVITTHNYIDLKNRILRKGAVSAQKDQMLLIPLNMRDGTLACVGKGNPDWNFSAPHGAGRLMSRSAAMKKLSMAQFEESMTGISSTSISKETLDEAPMAYKPFEEIMSYIEPTVDICFRMLPVYNFKASE